MAPLVSPPPRHDDGVAAPRARSVAAADTVASGRHRRPRARHHAGDPEPCDLRRARTTVPRRLTVDGTRNQHDAPAVDLDVWVCHVQFQRTGDGDLLADLVEEYTPYASSLAHRLVRHGDPLEDIQQVALEALVSSLHRFDVDRSLPFPAFARPTITGAIKRHFRDRGWSIRTPRSVHDIAAPMREAEEHLTSQLGRQPRREEVAEALGVPETTVRRADQAIHCRAATSLDQPGPDGGTPGLDALGGADPLLVAADDRIDLRDAIDHLDDRDRTLLSLYYVDELSQREIGRCFGVSQMQISRWLASCVGRLRDRIAPAPA